MNRLIHGDCLIEMPKLIKEGVKVDLVVIDPPYNIKKAEWDKWEKQDDYIEWLGSVFLECQRILKDNGSFYFFHNDFLQIVGLQNWINKNTKFVFRQLIVWNKKFSGCKNEGFLQGYNEVEMLRNYQKMAEYCLYYTFQDETGLTTAMLNINNFSSLRKYFKGYQKDTGLNKKQIIDLVGQKADHCFRWGSSQWDLPTKETYNELLKLPHNNGFLRKEYEDLRKEYEDLRYTFNNQKTHHSVWNYEVEQQNGHITPKPVDLIENIIKYSSNENNLVLDCFSGSGTTAIACMNTNRNYICIEKDEKYFELGKKRVENHKPQIKMAI